MATKPLRQKQKRLNPNTRIGDYTIKTIINISHTAHVYKVIGSNNEEYAMKIGEGKEMKVALENELEVIMEVNEIRSPYFMKIWSKEVSKYKNGDTEFYYFLMPFINAQNWSEFRKTFQDEHLSEIESCILLIEGIYCVQALHEERYVHGDIKPNNILRLSEDTARWFNHSIILDFGNAEIDGSNKTGWTGSSKYASPNIHQGGTLTIKDDMMSMLYIFIIMLQGKLPWSDAIKANKNDPIEKREEVLKLKLSFNNWLEMKVQDNKYNLPPIFPDLYNVIIDDNIRFDYNKLRQILREYIATKKSISSLSAKINV